MAQKATLTIEKTLSTTPRAVMLTTTWMPALSCALGGPGVRARAGGMAMETPLTPLEFMRRTRRLHPNREAVVDRDLRLTYDQFFDRCDRWAAALQGMGIHKGDRVAYIAANV